MLRTMARRYVGGLVAGGGATAAGVVAYSYYDTGFGRQCTFWSTVVPAATQYMACSMRHKKTDPEKRASEFGKLHDKYAPISLELIMSLRGLYVKFGQAAASSPFVPAAYRTQFKTLQSDLPSEDFAVIKKVVEKELGPLDAVFAEFSEAACGAASIGQAHVATLHSGERVVVKVQYPDAADIFAADVQCLRALVRFARPDALPAFGEFESQVALELDYRQELTNLTSIHGAVMPKYADRVVIPHAHRSLCTDRVLTMEYLAGPKLESEMRRQMEALGMKVDERESMRDWLMRLDASQEGNEMDAAAQPDGDSVGSRLGRVAARLIGLELVLWLVDKAVSWRGSASALSAAGEPGTSPRSQQQLRECLASLVEVHGYEMFAFGLFNADPHPGNLIGLADGRVGLIDYGQCKRLTPEPRRAIAELMVKVADQAPYAEVAAAFRRVGVRTEKGGDEFLGKMATLMFGRVTLEMLEPSWHRELHKSDKIVHFPPELLMVHRVALILRGLSVALRQNLSVAELWRPHAAAALAAPLAEE